MARRFSAILFLAAGALCAQACSSSSSGGGTGGTTGSGGVTGTGGHVATGGTTGGTGGVTGTGGRVDGGTDVPADAPTDTTTATDAGNLAVLCPGMPGDAGRSMYSPAMTASEFCHLFIATCNGANRPADGGFTNEAACEAAYTGLTYETTRECRSDHVCNAAVYFPAAMPVHCGHAAGNPPCADVLVDAGPAADASGQ